MKGTRVSKKYRNLSENTKQSFWRGASDSADRHVYSKHKKIEKG